MKSTLALRNLYQKNANALESSGYSSLADISQQPFDKFSQTVCDQLSIQDAKELYRNAQKYVSLTQTEQRKIIYRANPQLQNIKHLEIEPQNEVSMGYEGIYDQRNVAYAEKNSIASMFSPAAYLTQLYQKGQKLHITGNIHSLDKRRPDLQSLTLSQSNQDTEISTLALSNEILRNTISEPEIEHKLTTLLYPFDLLHHAPFSNIEMALDLQKTSFKKLADSLPTSHLDDHTYSAFANHLSPALVSDLLTPIPTTNEGEGELNTRLKQHFGSDATVESLSSIKTFCKKTGVSRDELNDYLTLSLFHQSNNDRTNISSLKAVDSISVNLPVEPGQYGGLYLNSDKTTWLGFADNFISRVTINIKQDILDRVKILPSVNNRSIIFAAYAVNYIDTQTSQPFVSGYIDIIIDDIHITSIYDDKMQEALPLIHGARKVEFCGDKNSYKLSYGVGDPNTYKPGQWLPLIPPVNDNFIAKFASVNQSDLIKLSQIIRYCQKTGLTPATLDTLIVLSQDKTTQNEGETTKITINSKTLQLTNRVLDYMARYSISENDAVVLAGGAINVYEKAGETNQFDKLFNSPPLNNKYFTVGDKDTINFSPEDIIYQHERSVLKRALSVDDAGLLTLCDICTPDITECVRSLDNISLLYRVGLWAKLHSLTPQALQLILQLNNKKEALDTANLQMFFEYLQIIDKTTQWLEEQQLSVIALNAMTTTKYPETLLPEMQDLLKNLYNAVTNKALFGYFGLTTITAEPVLAGTPLQVDTWLDRAIAEHDSDSDSERQLSIKVERTENIDIQFDAIVTAVAIATLEAYSAIGDLLETQENVDISDNELYVYKSIPTGTVRIRLVLKTTTNNTLSSIPLTITSLACSSKSQVVATTHILPAGSKLPTPTALGLPPKSLKAYFASHLASSLGLSGTEQAIVLQDWMDLVALKQGLTLTSMDSFWLKIIKFCGDDKDTTANNASLAAFCQALWQLSLVIKNGQLSHVELALLVYKPKILISENEILSLTLANLQGVSCFKHLQARCGEDTNELLTVLNQNKLDISVLARLLNKPEKEVKQAAIAIGSVDTTSINITQASDIDLWLQKAEKLGISTSSLMLLLRLTFNSNYDEWQHQAGAILSGLSTTEQAQISEKQDEELSVVLCAYYQELNSGIAINTRDDIFQYLLIDNQVSSSIITTRIAEAISSIQLYINRCLQGLEVNVNKDNFAEHFFSDWDIYNKRYSTWAGVSQLAYYPENYLDPTLRYNQSNLQQKLLAEISQSKLSKESVITAYMNYLDSFEAIADLKVLCGYQHCNSLDKGKSYFTARSNSLPYAYYWRSLDNEASDGFDGFVASAWTAWEKIECPIQAFNDEIRPVIFNNRLYISWIEERLIYKGIDTDHKPIQIKHYDLKLSYQKINGNWTPAISFPLDYIKTTIFTSPGYNNEITKIGASEVALNVTLAPNGFINAQVTGSVTSKKLYIEVFIDNIQISRETLGDSWFGNNTYSCKPTDMEKFKLRIEIRDEETDDKETDDKETDDKETDDKETGFPSETFIYNCEKQHVNENLESVYLSYFPSQDAILFMLYDPTNDYDSNSIDAVAYGGLIDNKLQYSEISSYNWKLTYDFFSKNLNNRNIKNKLIRKINSVSYKVTCEPQSIENITVDGDIAIIKEAKIVAYVNNNSVPITLNYNPTGIIALNNLEPLAVTGTIKKNGNASDQSGNMFDVVTQEVVKSQVENGVYACTLSVTVTPKFNTQKADFKSYNAILTAVTIYPSEADFVLNRNTSKSEINVSCHIETNIERNYTTTRTQFSVFRTPKEVPTGGAGEFFWGKDHNTPNKEVYIGTYNPVMQRSSIHVINYKYEFNFIDNAPSYDEDGYYYLIYAIYTSNDSIVTPAYDRVHGINQAFIHDKIKPETGKITLSFGKFITIIDRQQSEQPITKELQYNQPIRSQPSLENLNLSIIGEEHNKKWSQNYTITNTGSSVVDQYTYQWEGNNDQFMILPEGETDINGGHSVIELPANKTISKTISLVMNKNNDEKYKKDFILNTVQSTDGTVNPAGFYCLHTDNDNHAQYMERNKNDPKRTRLNTLFSHELVKRASLSLDNVLSWESQHLQEPQLGEGLYVELILNKYTKEVHGTNMDFTIHMLTTWRQGDTFPLYSGVLSKENKTHVKLFLACFKGENFGSGDSIYITPEYSSKKPGYAGNIRFNKVKNGWVEETTPPQNFLGLDSANILKDSSEPMDFSGANGLYFWELFYYTPMLVTEKLLQAQNFAEAEHWLKYVLSPAGYLEGEPFNRHHVERQWNMRPLAEDTAWDDTQTDSTDPDIVAQGDPMHYKVATFMKLVDLLLARGDMAYRQLERDTLAEAKMWYVTALNLLGDEPDLPLAGNWQEPTLAFAAHQTEPKVQTDVHSQVGTANALIVLFHPSENEKLKGYWQTLNQRLYNLRHNLSITGEPLTLPIFATPADPKALQNAAAAASTAGGAQLPNVSIAIQRFPLMLASARNLVSQLIQFGDKLSAILERKDSEALGVLLQTQASELIVLSLQLQGKTIKQLQAEQQTLVVSLQGAKALRDNYQQLLDEGVSAVEKQCIDERISAGSMAIASNALHTASAFLNLAPNIFGFADGGSKWGAPTEAFAIAMEMTASSLTTTAEARGTSEQYRRREQEWTQQRDATKYQIQQIEAQQASLNIQVKAAQLQKDYIKTQQAHTQDQLDLFKAKFSNAALYSWLQGRLSAVFYQFYDLTIARSLKAQLGYQWETGDTATFIQPGAWDDNHTGLLCGEALMLNLAQMEAAYMNWDERALEVQRTVSMAQAMKLDSTGFTNKIKAVLGDTIPSNLDDDVCKHTIDLSDDSQLIATINLSSLALDQDYPENLGSTRRIKQVSVSLPALLGPYQDIQAVLAYNGVGGGIHQSCRHAAISHGLNDSGLFQLDFNDSKYLPFEGLPIVGDDGNSSLSLSFPNAKDKQQALLESLSDIILHIRYTIRH